MEGLQNLAGKIEELKDKLTDGEYKDLLDTAKECYEKKEEEKTKKKFMKVLCITSSVDTVYTRTSVDHDGRVNPGAMSSGERCVWYEYDDELEDYEGPVEKFSFIAKARQEEKVILFEIGSVGFMITSRIDMDICKMSNYVYDKLLKDKYMVDDGEACAAAPDERDRHPTTYVYLSHYEL